MYKWSDVKVGDIVTTHYFEKHNGKFCIAISSCLAVDKYQLKFKDLYCSSIDDYSEEFSYIIGRESKFSLDIFETQCIIVTLLDINNVRTEQELKKQFPEYLL